MIRSNRDYIRFANWHYTKLTQKSFNVPNLQFTKPSPKLHYFQKLTFHQTFEIRATDPWELPWISSNITFYQTTFFKYYILPNYIFNIVSINKKPNNLPNQKSYTMPIYFRDLQCTKPPQKLTLYQTKNGHWTKPVENVTLYQTQLKTYIVPNTTKNWHLTKTDSTNQ